MSDLPAPAAPPPYPGSTAPPPPPPSASAPVRRPKLDDVTPVSPVSMTATCQFCGRSNCLQAMSQNMVSLRRPKYGAGWVVLTLFLWFLAPLIWLMMPRVKVVTGVDRFTFCHACGASFR